MVVEEGWGWRKCSVGRSVVVVEVWWWRKGIGGGNVVVEIWWRKCSDGGGWNTECISGRVVT